MQGLKIYCIDANDLEAKAELLSGRRQNATTINFEHEGKRYILIKQGLTLILIDETNC